MTAPPGVLVDAHVHFYASFDAGSFLAAAVDNVRAAGEALGLGQSPFGYLLLTEAAGHRHFARFAGASRSDDLGPWRVRATSEPGSVVVCRGDTPLLALVEGRQVKSAEGLEVLAPASREEFPDGLPLDETWALVRDSGALPIIPWGFGKWWFARGRLVRRLVERARPHELYVGDGKGRPWRGPRPGLFAAAQARGILNLPGTDPFPFPQHVGRAGSFGFLAQLDIDLDAPAACLVRHVRGLTTQPPTYGRGESLVGFCVSQARLRRVAARHRPHEASANPRAATSRPR